MSTSNAQRSRVRATGPRSRRTRIKPQQKSLWRRLNEIEIGGKKKPKRADVISFTRELATLLESGIGMGHALRLLAGQRRKTPLGAVIADINDDLNAGSTLAEAMKKHPAVFPRIFVRTLSSSDRGVPLTTTLKQAGDFLDSAQSAVAQAKRAMIYPSLVFFVGIAVVIMLLMVSLPQMKVLFSSLDSALPLPTRVLLAISDTLRAYPLPIFGGLVVAVMALLRYLKTNRGRWMLHRAMLRTPILGEIVLGGDLARAAGALGSLSQVGLPLPEAMEVASETAGNEVVRAALVKVRQGLLAGEGLAGPLEEANIFPVSFVQTIKVAEDTGTLDKNLIRMSGFYQQDSTEKVKAMVALLEPLSTVVVALMVGFVALAVIMPMYTALSVVGGK